MILHPAIKGWTLRVSRETAKHDDPPDKLPTYVGLIYFRQQFHFRIEVSLEDSKEARAEVERRFEEWVYEFVGRDRSVGDEPPSPG